MPKTDDLNTIRDNALRIAVEHGFTEATLGEDVALMHSELSELLEDVREGLDPAKIFYTRKVEATYVDEEGNTVTKKIEVRASGPFNSDGTMNKPCGIPSEIADVIVRAAHFAGKHKIDLAGAVFEKMEYNRTRPIKHGGKVL